MTLIVHSEINDVIIIVGMFLFWHCSVSCPNLWSNWLTNNVRGPLLLLLVKKNVGTRIPLSLKLNQPRACDIIHMLLTDQWVLKYHSGWVNLFVIIEGMGCEVGEERYMRMRRYHQRWWRGIGCLLLACWAGSLSPRNKRQGRSFCRVGILGNNLCSWLKERGFITYYLPMRKRRCFLH